MTDSAGCVDVDGHASLAAKPYRLGDRLNRADLVVCPLAVDERRELGAGEDLFEPV